MGTFSSLVCVRYKTISDSPGGLDSWICFMQEDIQISFSLHIYRYLSTCIYMSIYRFSWFYFWNHFSFSSLERHSFDKQLLESTFPPHASGTSKQELRFGAEPTLQHRRAEQSRAALALASRHITGPTSTGPKQFCGQENGSTGR